MREHSPDAAGFQAEQQTGSSHMHTSTPIYVLSEDHIASSPHRELQKGGRTCVRHVQSTYSDEDDPCMSDAGVPSDSLTRLRISRSGARPPSKSFESSPFSFGSSCEQQPILQTEKAESDHDSLYGAPSDSLERLRIVRRAASARSSKRKGWPVQGL